MAATGRSDRVGAGLAPVSDRLRPALSGLLGGLLCLCGALVQAAPATHSAEVNGTGGSSATRVLEQWNQQFAKETKVSVKFAPATSDVGIREMTARRVDFGCTEIPLSAAELQQSDLLQFPLLIGGVAVIVNIPGVEPGALRLNSNLIARIFLGEIRYWNDEEIRAANPSASLPRLPITLVVRETAASTTLALTTFLAKTDKQWEARIGASKLPQWPAPTVPAATVKVMGQKVQATPGAIGYLNVDEAFRSRLSVVQLRNRAGQWVRPSRESILNAATIAGLGRSGEQIPPLINVDGATSWPIVEVTYVLVDRKPKNLERSRSTLNFFFWAFQQGDRMAAETGFVPLPVSTQGRNVGSFRSVLGPDNSPLDFLK